MPRTTLVTAATLAAVALTLTACAPTTPEPAATATATGAPDANAAVTVGLVLEPDNLDVRHTSGAALEQLLIDNVYQGLVTRSSDDNSVVPVLATDYEISEDGLTYTFPIREGVVFHSGEPLTASDVVTSYTQVKDDETLQGHGDFENVTSITATDESTVSIVLAQPNADFLFALTGRAGLVFDESDTTDLKVAANGTGAFTLDDWSKGDSVTLTRFDDYWGEKAGVAEVVLQYIPDFTAGVNAALDGGLDVLTAVDANLAPQLGEDSGFTLTRGLTTDKATLAFNNTKAPLSDPKVREALRLAIDHEALITAVGAGKPLYGPIPELDPGYEDLSDVITFDPERARELLAEAGQEDLTLTLTIPSFYGTVIPTFLVSAFDDIGVTLTVKSVEFATWLQDVYTNKDYDLSYVLHVEPRDFGNWANPEYYFQYNSADVQKLYTEALAEVDPAKSADLLAEAARLVAEDHAADWLYNAETITAVGPGISGFPVNSINSRLNLAAVTKSQE